MTSNALFAIGTLLSWVGWFFVLRTVILGASLLGNGPDLDKPRVMKDLGPAAATAAILLVLASLMSMKGGTAVGPGQWRFPLVWFVMPYTAWLGTFCFAMGAARLVQAWLALNGEEQVARFKSAGSWGVAVVIFVGLYIGDKTSSVTILKGGIVLTVSTALAIILLAVAALVAMALAGRAAATRGFARSLISQIALIVGSIVFGLPFAFLLITSFKEDRDMSSANGIVWIPKVQDTLPFFDKKDPVFEGTYQGQTVQGSIIEQHPDGTVRVDIFKPLAIRGTTFDAPKSQLKEVPKDAPIVTAVLNKVPIKGLVVENLDDGSQRVSILEPANLKGTDATFSPGDIQPVRHPGLRWQNYSEALSYLPPETNSGLVYLKNTLIIVIFSVIGTILSSSIVAYAFSRMNFPGKNALFAVLLSTMMLPAAVTLLPQFLIFRQFGWIDTLYPLWVPAFFGSAFNIFLLRQFFMGIPMELEDAAKIDGCSYFKAFKDIMLPQIKPALAVIAIWTFMAAWNNFMGPLIYINSPENMPLSYALQMYNSDRGAEPGLLMAFAAMTMVPVLALFFFAQKYFIEGVTLSGLGGR